MAEIDVSDAAVEAGLRASYMLMCEREGMAFSEDDFFDALNGDLERRDVAKAMMRAAIAAAVEVILEPVPQFGDSSSDSEWFDGVLTNIDPDDTFYKTRTLCRIRT